jgi:pimeloyl-ACP methyl ester carboxylesterase
LNPTALRDNVRQSALEIVLLAHILKGVTVDSSGCPGAAATAKFDTGTMALMGHSMGATIAQPVLAAEPLFRAAIFSGAGASWIENLIYKKHPLEVRPMAEIILNYAHYTRRLTEFDPIVSMVEWAGEPADGAPYDRHVIQEPIAGDPHHVLMLQGIIDNYILPPIANGMSLAMGLDMAGTSHDAANPGLSIFRPLEPLLAFSGRAKIAFPVSANASSVSGKTSTAVVTQHPEDGIEDGHEAAFQTEPPKVEYRCFLKSFAAGAPVVVDPAVGCDL